MEPNTLGTMEGLLKVIFLFFFTEERFGLLYLVERSSTILTILEIEALSISLFLAVW